MTIENIKHLLKTSPAASIKYNSPVIETTDINLAKKAAIKISPAQTREINKLKNVKSIYKLLGKDIDTNPIWYQSVSPLNDLLSQFSNVNTPTSKLSSIPTTLATEDLKSILDSLDCEVVAPELTYKNTSSTSIDALTVSIDTSKEDQIKSLIEKTQILNALLEKNNLPTDSLLSKLKTDLLDVQNTNSDVCPVPLNPLEYQDLDYSCPIPAVENSVPLQPVFTTPPQAAAPGSLNFFLNSKNKQPSDLSGTATPPNPFSGPTPPGLSDECYNNILKTTEDIKILGEEHVKFISIHEGLRKKYWQTQIQSAVSKEKINLLQKFVPIEKDRNSFVSSTNLLLDSINNNDTTLNVTLTNIIANINQSKLTTLKFDYSLFETSYNFMNNFTYSEISDLSKYSSSLSQLFNIFINQIDFEKTKMRSFFPEILTTFDNIFNNSTNLWNARISSAYDDNVRLIYLDLDNEYYSPENYIIQLSSHFLTQNEYKIYIDRISDDRYIYIPFENKKYLKQNYLNLIRKYHIITLDKAKTFLINQINSSNNVYNSNKTKYKKTLDTSIAKEDQKFLNSVFTYKNTLIDRKILDPLVSILTTTEALKKVTVDINFDYTVLGSISITNYSLLRENNQQWLEDSFQYEWFVNNTYNSNSKLDVHEYTTINYVPTNYDITNFQTNPDSVQTWKDTRKSKLISTSNDIQTAFASIIDTLVVSEYYLQWISLSVDRSKIATAVPGFILNASAVFSPSREISRLNTIIDYNDKISTRWKYVDNIVSNFEVEVKKKTDALQDIECIKKAKKEDPLKDNIVPGAAMKPDGTSRFAYADPNDPILTDIAYWRQFAKIATIANLIPINWSLGLIIPTPAGIFGIPLPIIWIPLVVIPVPLVGVFVVFIGQCGIMPAPYLYLYNSLLGVSGFLAHLKGASNLLTLSPSVLKSDTSSKVSSLTTSLFKLKRDIRISVPSLKVANPADQLKYAQLKPAFSPKKVPPVFLPALSPKLVSTAIQTVGLTGSGFNGILDIASLIPLFVQDDLPSYERLSVLNIGFFLLYCMPFALLGSYFGGIPTSLPCIIPLLTPLTTKYPQVPSQFPVESFPDPVV